MIEKARYTYPIFPKVLNKTKLFQEMDQDSVFGIRVKIKTWGSEYMTSTSWQAQT